MTYSSAFAPVIRPVPAIRKILVTTDFSACSKSAIPYACLIARTYGSEVQIMNVLGPQPLLGPMGVSYTYSEQDRQTAFRQLQAIGQGPEFRTITTEFSVHRGEVGEVVCRVVEEQKIDLLVLGTHGRRGLKQFVMGSAAEHLFRHVSCPVLTVGPGAPKDVAPDAGFKRILAATDLTPKSAIVVEYAEGLARNSGAHLTLFHAIPDRSQSADEVSLDDQIAAAKKRLELAVKNVDNDTSLKIGRAAELIIETATEREADLIVIGARRGLRLAAHSPWAVAHEVVCAAPCPVITVSH